MKLVDWLLRKERAEVADMAEQAKKRLEHLEELEARLQSDLARVEYLRREMGIT